MSGEEGVSWQRWHEQRETSVRGVPGNLTLIGFQRLTNQDAPVEHLAGGPAATTTVRRSTRGAVFTLADGVAEVDGSPVTGEIEVDLLRPNGTPVLRVGGLAVDVFSLDGGDAELRVYDPRSPALARFAGIDVYPYDPEWVLPATWAPTSVTPVAWGFSRESDTGHAKKVPGVLELQVAKQQVRLTAFLDGEALVVVFADGTTGDESYQPGRFLRMERAEGPETAVDFNRAFIPPCGFSDWYSCPLPPPENRILAPVRAGERTVRWHPSSSETPTTS